MGELLSPFYLKEDAILATEENMNNITEAGIYTLGQPNLQSTGPYDHGYMIVMRRKETIYQTMFSIRGTIYQRYRSTSGEWNKWYKISSVEYT